MTGRVVIVTGTNTGVGKTVATATLASRARTNGERVAVVKPVQTGTADGDCDAAEIHRLTGIEVHELTSLEEPLAPDTAARRAGVEIPPVAAYAPTISALTSDNDLVLVEGAGGLLVRLDTKGGTLLDLADTLLAEDVPTSFVVVTAAGLGTLNHTELTVAALRARGYEPDGLIIGSWPDDPGLAERCNRIELPRVTGVPLLFGIPEGIDNHSQLN
ncbi:dethiobiotin synthase [Nocardioides albus]|uniref:ATP-dependent dethiobiotin synthetase BioD n=1 Tax=Nocardioides albus TaxID=1841 RepID=A0A7W5FA91_9ACTN|nr:dethiobiotin synthase [Nocardioides albus]MBB3090882.1 dethiobiotin synthase [Nocardioides albus]GGU38125.1 ATP-dependent dethiobiotin synthetase BioD [Nocardioides albus]